MHFSINKGKCTFKSRSRSCSQDQWHQSDEQERCPLLSSQSLNSFNCSGNYKNNREIESETSNDLKKERGIEGLAVELRRLDESIDRGIEVEKDRGTEESRKIEGQRNCRPWLWVSIGVVFRSLLCHGEHEKTERQWWWRIGGGFEPFLRTVGVSIGGGSVVVWRIGGGFDRWWFLSVEDRWWFWSVVVSIGGGSVVVSIGGGGDGFRLCLLNGENKKTQRRRQKRKERKRRKK